MRVEPERGAHTLGRSHSLSALAVIAFGVGLASLVLAANVANSLPEVGVKDDPVSRSLLQSALFLFYVAPGLVLGLGLTVSGIGCWLRWRWALPAAAVFLALELLWACYIALIGWNSTTTNFPVDIGWVFPAIMAVMSVIGLILVFVPSTRSS